MVTYASSGCKPPDIPLVISLEFSDDVSASRVMIKVDEYYIGCLTSNGELSLSPDLPEDLGLRLDKGGHIIVRKREGA